MRDSESLSQSPVSRRRFIRNLALAAGASALNWTGLGALAAQVPSKKDLPVVVIGSGLGGLVSAAYLARFGFPVTLLEQHAIPGGYATAFDRGDFTFDVSLHATVVKNAVPQRILTDLGLWDRVAVAHAPELRRIKAHSYDITLPARDPKGVMDALSKAFPDEREGIHGFYSEMEAVVHEMAAGGGTHAVAMKRLSKISLAQWMDGHVTRPEVQSCMAVFSSYYGVPPHRINALFYAIATGEYLVHGGQYYHPRSQDLSDLLVSGIEAAGGEVIFNTPAERIDLDAKGRVTRVLDAQGNHYPARAVVANCPVPTLKGKMLPRDAFPPAFQRKIEKRKPSLSSFVVWLGLNQDLSHIPGYEINLMGEGRLTPGAGFTTDDLTRSKLSIAHYDNLYKGYSPPGKSTVSIVCLADYATWKPYEADYFKGKKGAYTAEKERIANALVARVEQELIPGFSKSIEVMEIGTPLTNAFYTGNPGGAIYGYDQTFSALGAETPVPGLYLAGAWSHGGGYTPAMMGGRDAARRLMQDFRTSRI